MDGNQQAKKFKDPFSAGQMVGMLVMMMFLEAHKDISTESIDKLKNICSSNASIFLEKPPEDVMLMIDNLIKDINI